MKLIFCNKCTDVVRLTTEKIKMCDCGRSSGKYTDKLNAWYKGPCTPLGFANSTFVHALKNQPESDWGETFTAFVIEKDCKTFKNKNKDE
jgi:hypothetical protein